MQIGDLLICASILCLVLTCYYLQCQIVRLEVLTGNDKWIDTFRPWWLRKVYIRIRERVQGIQ